MSLQMNGVGTANATLNGGSLSSLPSGASATWTSSDPAIATVQQSAVNPLQASVTPVSPGTCTITCSVKNADGSSSAGQATEIVVPAPGPAVTAVSVAVTEQNP